MKLIKKLLSSVTAIACSVSVMCGGAALLTAGADDTYGVFTYDIIDEDEDGTYDYVRITDCDESAASVNIPAEINGLPVESIGFEAFKNCKNLESITLPDGVKSIGDGAFSYCTSLKSITLPDSVTSIEMWAFCSCTSLKSITIPDSVTNIRISTFKDCTSLESVTLPTSVTSIARYAFYGCTSLESITIPDGVTSITEYAFFRCENLKSVHIPDNVTSIGDSAFCFCESLKSITLPDSVTSIADYAFDGCESLESITILNTACEIVMGDETISNGYDENNNAYYKGIIYSYADSTAQTYADEYNYKFLAINDYGVLGDADGDGKVTAKDASLMFSEFKRIYNSEPSTFTEEQMKRCDLNGDGKITAIDVSKVFSIYKENYRRG